MTILLVRENQDTVFVVGYVMANRIDRNDYVCHNR